MPVAGKFIHIALSASLVLPFVHVGAADPEYGTVEKLSVSAVTLYEKPRVKREQNPVLRREDYPGKLAWELLQPRTADNAYVNVRTPLGDGWVKKSEVRLSGTPSSAVTAGVIAEEKTTGVAGTRAIGDTSKAKKP